MRTNEIITGNDVYLTLDLTKEGATFTINPGATVTAVVRTNDTVLSSTITANSAESGADWTTGKVVLLLTAAVTSAMAANMTQSRMAVMIEVRVNDSGKTGWLFEGYTLVESKL